MRISHEILSSESEVKSKTLIISLLWHLTVGGMYYAGNSHSSTGADLSDAEKMSKHKDLM